MVKVALRAMKPVSSPLGGETCIRVGRPGSRPPTMGPLSEVRTSYRQKMHPAKAVTRQSSLCPQEPIQVRNGPLGPGSLG